MMKNNQKKDNDRRIDSDFIMRTYCPICNQQGELLTDIPLTEPFIYNYIKDYYKDRVPKKINTNGNYSWYYCDSCQFLYQGNVLSEYWEEQLYEKWISPEESFIKFRKAQKVKVIQAIKKASKIEKLLQKPPNSVRVLDFGAGWGSFASVLRVMGYHVDVCELSKSRIDYLDSLGHNIVEISINNNCSNEELYTIIHTEQVFEHIPDPKPLLMTLTKLLAPGGLIFIGVPDARKYIKILKNINVESFFLPERDLKVLAPFEHVNGFTNYSLQHLANYCGLKSITIRSSVLDFSNEPFLEIMKWFLAPYRRNTSMVFVKSK